MNLQKEPFQAICEALAAAINDQIVIYNNSIPGVMGQIPQLKNAQVGWPDPKWLQVDGNLPAVFFVQISETGKNIVSRFKVHKVVDNGDGTGTVYTEQLRLSMMLQMSLFTNTPQDRAALGWLIKQYMITNYRLALADGEYAMFEFKGDHQGKQGETNFYQRDMTFTVTARVLDATSAYKVTNLNPNYDFN